MPGSGAPGTDLEAADNGKDLYNVIDAHADQIVEPGREYYQTQTDHGVGQGICKGREHDLFAC